MTKCYDSLVDAAAALRSRRTTSTELVTAAIERADRSDAAVGVFVTRFVDESLTAAASADCAAGAGSFLGPLHGVPIAIKDLLFTREAPTTAQSAAFDGRWTAHDAEVVRRLRDAGAIIMGKTTTMEFATGIPDPTSGFPVPRNPWNLDTWAGGSSSGSASGVAADMFLGAVGTDTAGSIRIPAAFCGITGLMPSYGRVPTSGCVPLAESVDHVGPMARTARDCALLLSVMAGEPSAPVTAARADLTGKRIGVARLTPADTPEHAVFETALATLSQQGAELVEIELPQYGEMCAALAVIVAGEMLAYHLANAQQRFADYVPSNRIELGCHTLYSAADYVQAQRVRRHVDGLVHQLFRDLDAVASLTVSMGAMSIDDLISEDFARWIGAINTLYWDGLSTPAISLPCGFTPSGMPLGLHVAGPPGDEAGVLSIADVYQRATDWHLRRPPSAVRPSSSVHHNPATN